MQPNPHQMPHLSCQWHCHEPARLLLPLVAPLAFLSLQLPTEYAKPTKQRFSSTDRQVSSLLFLYLIDSAITTCYSYVWNCLLLHFNLALSTSSVFLPLFIVSPESFIHRPARGSPQEQAYTSNAQRTPQWLRELHPKRKRCSFRNQREGHSGFINPAGNKTMSRSKCGTEPPDIIHIY